MLTHRDVWRAIDLLAARQGISVSRLARRAGLDPTTFNKSKRVGRGGRPRWPGTQSIAKVLASSGVTMNDFFNRIGAAQEASGLACLPLIGLAEAAALDPFDEQGRRDGPDWDEIPFPSLDDPEAFALEVSAANLEPVYREGDILVASPGTAARRGDRIVLRTRFGEVAVKVLVRRTARRIDVRAMNPDHGRRSIALEDISWLARIVWASQ